MRNSIAIFLVGLFFGLVFFNCTNNRENKTDKIDPGYQTIEMKTTSPNFSYTIFTRVDSLNIYYDSILVTDGNNKQIQSISLDDKVEWGQLSKYKQEPFPFYFEDCNFDGYQDLSVTRQISVMANVFCSFWLFDPEQRKLVYDYQLSSLNSASFDSLRKEIICSYKAGVNEPVIEEKYKWEGDKLVRLE